MAFRFYFPVFSLMLIIRYSKWIEILLFSVSFCPPKSIIINSFLHVQTFSAVLRQREKI